MQAERLENPDYLHTYMQLNSNQVKQDKPLIYFYNEEVYQELNVRIVQQLKTLQQRQHFTAKGPDFVSILTATFSANRRMKRGHGPQTATFVSIFQHIRS